MNLFELQTEFARQWFTATRAMTAAMLEASSVMSRQAVATWTGTLSGGQISPYQWPFMAWPQATAFSTPFTFPGANPFLGQFGQPQPWSGWFGFPASTFAMGAPNPWTAAAMHWPWIWPTPSALQPWWMAGLTPARPPSLVDQVAANYRSASGYAAAAVIAPLKTALEAHSTAQPWWQATWKPSLH